MSVIELKEKRMAAVTEMRSINDTAKAENRNFTEEERKRWDALKNEVESMATEIEKEEREAVVAGFDTEKPVVEERKAADESAEFRDYLMGEKRDLSVGTGGGALAPEAFVAEVIDGIAKAAPLTAAVHKLPVKGAASIGAPAVSVDATDAAWTAEVGPIPQDSTLAYTKRTMTANSLAKGIKVSKKLQKTSALNIDVLVKDMLGKKFASAIENAICNGTGSGQPLGLFVADANGIPTTRDVVTAGASLAADDFIDLVMSIAPGYRKNAVLIMNTAVVKAAMKLKDQNGAYIYQPSFRDGAAPTICGVPVIESEFAPSAMSTGSYIAVVGDLDYYWWLQSVDLEVQVMKEQYGAANVGFDGLMFCDGAPVLPEAFARLQIQ